MGNVTHIWDGNLCIVGFTQQIHMRPLREKYRLPHAERKGAIIGWSVIMPDGSMLVAKHRHELKLMIEAVIALEG